VKWNFCATRCLLPLVQGVLGVLVTAATCRAQDVPAIDRFVQSSVTDRKFMLRQRRSEGNPPVRQRPSPHAIGAVNRSGTAPLTACA
jgi:hypothetical protein